MKDATDSSAEQPSRPFSFGKGLYFLAAPLPVPLINIVLGRLIRAMGKNRPEIFSRLEGHHHKWFLIDPVNLPFVLCLRPDPRRPQLKSCRRHGAPAADSRIAGTFLTLLGMIDGRYDGDALFFARDLCVEGDTEAVVCLRNALDDVDGSIMDDIAAFFGGPIPRFLKFARKVSANVHDA
ncbi:MAG: SCP2 sterol-binding domain-containing protein [Micavibrio sp.]